MTALDLFVRHGVQALPVDIKSLLDSEKVTLMDYQAFADNGRIPRQRLLELYGPDAFTQKLLSGRYLVCYNPRPNNARVRWTLAHELAHILLGHVEHTQPAGACPDNRDRAADCFAADILAPLPVLLLCQTASARELAALTLLSAQAAQNRYENLKSFAALHPSPTVSDRQYALHFLDFIYGYNSANSKGKALNPAGFL